MLCFLQRDWREQNSSLKSNRLNEARGISQRSPDIFFLVRERDLGTRLPFPYYHTRHMQQASHVNDQLPESLKCHADVASKKGPSSWLSVLPIGEYGFHLHKGEFRDALRLRYNWQLNSTPRTCTCGAQFTVDHAMICHMGGFPTIRHNEVRDMTASLLTEVCHNVATEPPLQPLSREKFSAIDQQIPMIMPASISVQEASGTTIRMYFST